MAHARMDHLGRWAMGRKPRPHEQGRFCHAAIQACRCFRRDKLALKVCGRQRSNMCVVVPDGAASGNTRKTHNGGELKYSDLRRVLRRIQYECRGPQIRQDSDG